MDLDGRNLQVEKFPVLRVHMPYCYLTIMAVKTRKDSCKEVILGFHFPTGTSTLMGKGIIEQCFQHAIMQMFGKL